MKKLMMICALLFSVITFAKAQQSSTKAMDGMMRPEDKVKKYDEKLKLSEDQKAKLTAIFTEQDAAMKKLHEDDKTGDKNAMKTKMQAMHNDDEAKVMAVLTEDQKKLYKAWKMEKKTGKQKAMKQQRDSTKITY